MEDAVKMTTRTMLMFSGGTVGSAVSPIVDSVAGIRDYNTASLRLQYDLVLDIACIVGDARFMGRAAVGCTIDPYMYSMTIPMNQCDVGWNGCSSVCGADRVELYLHAHYNYDTTSRELTRGRESA